MRCFASLFFSAKQIQWVALGNIVDGRPIQTFLDNPNFLFLSASRSVVSSSTRNSLNIVANKFSRISSSHCLRGLSFILLNSDGTRKLPLVVFCSLTWITQPNAKEEKETIGDHKFSLIKHDNNHFQLIQGYKCQSQEDCISSSSRSSSYDCIESEGFHLSSWQSSKHAYSSSDGFQRSTMQVFLDSLADFIRNSRFDGENHEECFGVKPRSGMIFWPSFSFRVLDDSLIIGCGEKPLANALEQFVDEGK
jgi:hypothetical protein